MKRGDLVLVALSGDYGKPRPALVVQSDYFNEIHPSISVAPLTSTLVDAPQFRLTLEPGPRNGLRSLSQVMIDKTTAVRADRVGVTIGEVSDETITRVNRALMLWFGLAA